MKNDLDILIIEGHSEYVAIITQLLLESKTQHYNLFIASSLASATDFIHKNKFDIMLLGLELPNGTGLDAFRAITNLESSCPIIIISSLLNEEDAATAVKEGAQDYFIRETLTSILLSRAIRYAIERKKSENILRNYVAIIECTGAAIIGVTFDGRIISWNIAAKETFGYTAEEMIGHDISFLSPSHLKNEFHALLQLILEGKKSHQHETVCVRKDGTQINVLLAISSIKDYNNKIVSVSMVSHDISLLKRAEKQLALQYRISVVLGESTTLTNATHSVLKIICETLDWQVGEIWAIDPSEQVLKCVSIFSVSGFQRDFQEISNQLILHKNEELPGYIWESNAPYWVENLNNEPKLLSKIYITRFGLRSCFGFPIVFHETVLGVMMFFSPQIRQLDRNFLAMLTAIGNQIGTFIKRKRMEDDLLYLSHHDALTGIANRVVLEDSLSSALTDAQRRHQLVALIFLDLDNFKKINDTLGHQIGDFLLIEISKRMENLRRETDTLARFGGDEFVIALPGIQTKENIIKIVKAILSAVSKKVIIDSNEISITISAGIAIYPEDGQDVKTLLKNADIALYNAKAQGKNNYQFFNQSSEDNHPGP